MTKKVTNPDSYRDKAIRCGEVFTSKISYDESPGGKVIYSMGLRLKSLLRAITGFLAALYFSLQAVFLPEVYVE
ncbi:MAG TPA: hypothetical protein VL095_06090 [Flavisolibacter sp.]|nr:hypothetical protein [Flavisolibacter sp.]